MKVPKREGSQGLRNVSGVIHEVSSSFPVFPKEVTRLEALETVAAYSGLRLSAIAVGPAP